MFFEHQYLAYYDLCRRGARRVFFEPALWLIEFPASADVCFFLSRPYKASLKQTTFE